MRREPHGYADSLAPRGVHHGPLTLTGVFLLVRKAI